MMHPIEAHPDRERSCEFEKNNILGRKKATNLVDACVSSYLRCILSKNSKMDRQLNGGNHCKNLYACPPSQIPALYQRRVLLLCLEHNEVGWLSLWEGLGVCFTFKAASSNFLE